MAKLNIDTQDEQRIEVLAAQLRESLLTPPRAVETTPEAWQRLVDDEVAVFRWKAVVALTLKAITTEAPRLNLHVRDATQLYHSLCEQLEPLTDVGHNHERIVIWDSIPREVAFELENFLYEVPERALEPFFHERAGNGNPS